MAFQRETNLTKDAIGDFAIEFFVPGPDNLDGIQSGQVAVQIIMSDGSIQTRQFDLLVRLQDDTAGQQHLQNLADLRDYIRSRLNDEVLPLY